MAAIVVHSNAVRGTVGPVEVGVAQERDGESDVRIAFNASVYPLLRERGGGREGEREREREPWRGEREGEGGVEGKELSVQRRYLGNPGMSTNLAFQTLPISCLLIYKRESCQVSKTISRSAF